MKRILIISTANEAAEMQLSPAVSTANIAAVADGDWALIAPYGDHPAPNGAYVQHFDRGQAEKIVGSWNSISGLALRLTKNALHGRIGKSSAPVWDGHPETDKARWPKEKLLAEITDLRAGDDGLEGCVTWNSKDPARRTPGPLYPSAWWFHWPPSGDPPVVYPEILASVGLVRQPNISGVPAWTHNARLGDHPLAGDPQAENQNDNIMNEKEIMALRKALGLPESADFSAILTSANAAQAAVATISTANSAKADAETKLTTANAKVDQLTTDLATANGKVGTLTTERDTFKTANGALTKGILDLAEKRGIIAPADRSAFETRIATANTAADAFKELAEKKPALNTTHVEINGNRIDITTANSRQQAFDSAVSKRMKDEGCDRDTAFGKCLIDPALAGLVNAMKSPKTAG